MQECIEIVRKIPRVESVGNPSTTLTVTNNCAPNGHIIIIKLYTSSVNKTCITATCEDKLTVAE